MARRLGMEPASDTLQLLNRWHAGDRQALDRLVERDLPWIRGYVESRLGPQLRAKGEVDDYVQEAVVHVLSYGPKFVMSDRQQFRSLVARIAENVLRDHAQALRRKKRDTRRERPVPTDSILCLDPPQADVTRPSQAVARDQERAWIRLAIELLPAEDRAIVRMREWEQMSFAEIAAELGLSEDAARMRFHRTLPKLAKHVERLEAGDVKGVLAETMG